MGREMHWDNSAERRRACTGGALRTLQASVDLDDNGDKVIFRQFGGKSSLRTLKSGHTAIRADQFDPEGWRLPEEADSYQNNDQGMESNYISTIDHPHQRPRMHERHQMYHDYTGRGQ